MDSLTNKVKETLNLTSSKTTLPSSLTQHTISHAATTNAVTWKEALSSNTSSAPAPYHLTKTLVFKPKTAKGQNTVLILVVALDDTPTNSSQISKAAAEKEARFATPEVVKEVLGVCVEEGILLPPYLANCIHSELFQFNRTSSRCGSNR